MKYPPKQEFAANVDERETALPPQFDPDNKQIDNATSLKRSKI